LLASEALDAGTRILTTSTTLRPDRVHRRGRRVL